MSPKNHFTSYSVLFFYYFFSFSVSVYFSWLFPFSFIFDWVFSLVNFECCKWLRKWQNSYLRMVKANKVLLTHFVKKKKRKKKTVKKIKWKNIPWLTETLIRFIYTAQTTRYSTYIVHIHRLKYIIIVDADLTQDETPLDSRRIWPQLQSRLPIYAGKFPGDFGKIFKSLDLYRQQFNPFVIKLLWSLPVKKSGRSLFTCVG